MVTRAVVGLGDVRKRTNFELVNFERVSAAVTHEFTSGYLFVESEIFLERFPVETESPDMAIGAEEVRNSALTETGWISKGAPGSEKKTRGRFFFLRPLSTGLTNYVIRHKSIYSNYIELRSKSLHPNTSPGWVKHTHPPTRYVFLQF
jgi:hypothetical protein